MGEQIVRVQACGFTILGQCLAGIAFVLKAHARPEVGDIVVPGRGQSVNKQRLVIPPIGQLIFRDDDAGSQHHDSRDQDDGFGNLKVIGQLAYSKHNGDEYADEREICVAVGHGLRSHLNQADDRHEGSQKPKPANEETRTAFARQPNGGGNARQDRRGRRQGQPGNFFRQRVKDRKVGRPDHFQQIKPVGNGRVFQALVQRNLFKRGDGLAMALSHQSGQARSGQQQEERPFLKQQTAENRELKGEDRKSLQRPKVQQEHDERQRNQHRLGHQAQRKKQKRQTVKK